MTPFGSIICVTGSNCDSWGFLVFLRELGWTDSDIYIVCLLFGRFNALCLSCINIAYVNNFRLQVWFIDDKSRRIRNVGKFVLRILLSIVDPLFGCNKSSSRLHRFSYSQLSVTSLFSFLVQITYFDNSIKIQKKALLLLLFCLKFHFTNYCTQ